MHLAVQRVLARKRFSDRIRVMESPKENGELSRRGMLIGGASLLLELGLTGCSSPDEIEDAINRAYEEGPVSRIFLEADNGALKSNYIAFVNLVAKRRTEKNAPIIADDPRFKKIAAEREQILKRIGKSVVKDYQAKTLLSAPLDSVGLAMGSIAKTQLDSAIKSAENARDTEYRGVTASVTYGVHLGRATFRMGDVIYRNK